MNQLNKILNTLKRTESFLRKRSGGCSHLVFCSENSNLSETTGKTSETGRKYPPSGNHVIVLRVNNVPPLKVLSTFGFSHGAPFPSLL